MAMWSREIDAQRNTWMVEMTITDLARSFTNSPDITMKVLTANVPGASGEMDKVSVDAHLNAFMLLMRNYNPTWEPGITYQKAIPKIRAVMEDEDKTLKELAAVVDEVLLFKGELEGVADDGV